VADLTDLAGRVALVTGANSGVGYWTALGLARRGARVVMACRSMERAGAALAELRGAVPSADLTILKIDLADLASVRTAAAEFNTRYDRLDLLVNNAGVALTPLSRTTDGFELQFGANFLGHFALTGRLLDTVTGTPASRIVQVGSLAHRIGRIRYDDTGFERLRYSSLGAYSQSKLANVMHTLELDERLRHSGSTSIAVGAHPGAAGTGIADDFAIMKVPGIPRVARWLEGKVLNSPESAAEPSLAAATLPGVVGGSYFGPDKLMEIRGAPTAARIAKRARVEEDRRRLWELAERLTGVSYL
jgi:NAD(P)-dependent dehydrogenase (short-subunit alcohol dehydrogenase family)